MKSSETKFNENLWNWLKFNEILQIQWNSFKFNEYNEIQWDVIQI